MNTSICRGVFVIKLPDHSWVLESLGDLSKSMTNSWASDDIPFCSSYVMNLWLEFTFLRAVRCPGNNPRRPAPTPAYASSLPTPDRQTRSPAALYSLIGIGFVDAKPVRRHVRYNLPHIREDTLPATTGRNARPKHCAPKWKPSSRRNRSKQRTGPFHP